MTTERSNAPLVILLVGPTGSSKSSFVRSLTKEKVEVNGQKPCAFHLITSSPWLMRISLTSMLRHN